MHKIFCFLPFFPPKKGNIPTKLNTWPMKVNIPLLFPFIHNNEYSDLFTKPHCLICSTAFLKKANIAKCLHVHRPVCILVFHNIYTGNRHVLPLHHIIRKQMLITQYNGCTIMKPSVLTLVPF